jgi:hypothetical protein
MVRFGKCFVLCVKMKIVEGLAYILEMCRGALGAR